jgi:diguanylate cyclase (GGDEF)-like protein
LAESTAHFDSIAPRPDLADDEPGHVPARPYAPISQVFEDARGRDLRLAGQHRQLPSVALRAFSRGLIWQRVKRDSNLLLALAIAIPVVLVEAISGMAPTRLALGTATLFLAGQLALSLIRPAPTWLAPLRLAASLAFVLFVNAAVHTEESGPLRILLVPIVALAAANGGRGGSVVAAAGIGATFAPLLYEPMTDVLRQRTLALAASEVVLALGSRQLVLSLRHTTERLRNAGVRVRRRARQLSAVELVGQTLAREGPTPGTFDRVMDLLEGTFGYTYPSYYSWDAAGGILRLEAQRGYATPIHTLPRDRGVMGRVVRSRKPVFLPDVRNDPDFVSADPSVVSEISIPLLADADVLGILNVEAARTKRLDGEDFGLLQIVADRLAASVALGRERQKLTERAALLDRLMTFSARLNETLDPVAIHSTVTRGAARVIDADMVTLTMLEPQSGEYRVAAIEGGDETLLGARILPGEGVSGGAMAARAVVVDDNLERARFPRATAGARIADVISAMGVPLTRDEAVTGALGWYREDRRPFTEQEREVAVLVAAQVSLATANASLHHAAQHAATTDALTGLHNRRYFDAAIERMMALRNRVPVVDRRPISVILFDLDHFGAVNKQHGHQVGDRVLVEFAETLRSRVRDSDLVARHGGEEFLVVLDGATSDDAVRLANDVRIAFEGRRVARADGTTISCSVSAGCAALKPSQASAAILLQRADVGLGMAKEAGRNRVVAA